MKYLLAKNKIYIINTKYLSPNLKNYKCKIFHIQHYSLATLILECSHYSKFVYIISVCVHICVYPYASVCTCACVYSCIHVYPHACMCCVCVPIHVHLCAHTHAYVCVCVCLCLHICVLVHVCTSACVFLLVLRFWILSLRLISPTPTIFFSKFLCVSISC